ncbi:MAG TPA: ABC transporter ATP-binding protein [Xanthobacteraceae bacterium]|jgi:NitT/TauT family transport system ATP-binding protein|nr:ABC transporter ATP-binding protein [Xanthobacteraceae bacterium]
MPPIVALQKVSKAYPNRTLALDKLDFEIGQGEFVALLGPSGCGKSTALRLIAGLEKPSRGAIDWGAADAHSIGFVFQEPTLMPWATLFENVYLPLKLQGIKRAAAKQDVLKALDDAGLHEFAEAYPRELSGGMKMRASIARALVTEPKLLLMDEPFAALDEMTRFRLGNDLLKLWGARGKTVVFVTHSVFESVFLSQRVIVMTPRPGRVFTEIVVNAPYPRDENFRTSSVYAGLCRAVSAALADATATDGAS